MARTGATRRDTDGPLQAIINRIQTNSFFQHAPTDTPDGRLTDSVIDTLGLSDQPFRAPGGAVPYFYNEQLEALLDELEACVGNAETLVVLEGAPEAGKTCTVAQLLERFYDGGHVFLSRGGPAISADSIIRSMLSAYRSTTPQSTDDCVEQLIDHIASHADIGAALVLVIEDAERMATTELQQLLNAVDTLNSHISEPMSVLFTSTETAENLLAGLHSAHIDSGQVDAFTLPRLDATETASYIATRLAAAGHAGDLPLDDRELQVLSQNSNGLPGYVDRNAAKVLNQRITRQRFHAVLAPAQWLRATRQHLRWVIIGLSMVMLGLAIGSWNAQPTTVQSDTVIKPLALPTDSAAASDATASTGASDSAVAEPVAEPVLRTAETRVEPVIVDEVAASGDIADTATTTTTADSADSTTADADTLVAPTVDTSTADAGTGSTDQPSLADNATASEDSLVATAATPSSDATAAAPAEADAVVTDASESSADTTDIAAVEEPAETVVQAAVEVAAVDQAVATSESNPEPTQPLDGVLSGVISGEKWIQRRDPDRFTVQLLAGADEAALRLHARRHGMTSMSAIYRTLRNGQPWFALVHGDFASSNDAREAVASLPEIWQQNSPWIRRFDDVHKVIN